MIVPNYLNTRLPLFSVRAKGKWKNLKIFQVIKGKQFLRAYTDYDGSAKGHLIPFQSKFAAAVWNWQNMSQVKRRVFISRAAKLGLRISGYNYFISLYMRDRLEDYMGYPDPHHLSHESGGADEINFRTPPETMFEIFTEAGILSGRQESIGLSWADLGQQGAETWIRSLAYLGNGIVLAGSDPSGKIFRSTDYGITWADLGQQGAELYIHSLAYLGNGIVLAGSAPNGKIFRSTDYGITWADLGQQGAETRIYSLAYLGNGIALAGSGLNGKILRST